MMRDRTTLDCVREFHKSFGIKQEGVTIESIRLRLKLISEEFKEVVEAATDVAIAEQELKADPVNIQKSALFKAHQRHLMKELCDLQYVLDGTFDVFDWDKQSAFNRVHTSNMSKLGEDGKPVYRDDGKVLKGPNYKEPDMEGLI